jgi:uncharacterized protein (TIGR03437 family)
VVRHSVIFGFLAVSAYAGSLPSATMLQSSANPSVFGQSVTLAVTVSPAAATGNVTFYDGFAILGVSKLSGGQVALTTILPSSGVRSLKAFYGGDASYQPSTSAVFPENVIAKPQNGFRPAVNSGTVDPPVAITLADFNGDGRVDLAVVDFTNNQVNVLLGDGTGGFQSKATYGVRTGPQSVSVGDVNSDGWADLVVASSSGIVSVLLGNGDGTFHNGSSYGVDGSPQAVAIADFNADGRADLVVASSTGSVSVLLGNGDGSFQPAVVYNVAGGNSVAVADFNQDGIADLVVPDSEISGNSQVSVLLGKGDGTFQKAVATGVGYFGVQSVAVADFNGDGLPDLAVPDTDFRGITSVAVLLGNGDGTFRRAVNYPVSAASQYVTVGDFNGDGQPDLAVSGSKGNVDVLFGNGDGTFQAAVSSVIAGSAGPTVIGDFNGDGMMDLAVANYSQNTVSVLLGGAADLSIAASTGQGFVQGQSGTYTISVQNVGILPTASIVTVTDSLNPWMTAAAISGAGWTCSPNSVSCTRSDALPPGASYPPISLSVSISSSAPSSVNNTVIVSGGNEINAANDSATVQTVLASSAPTITTLVLAPGLVGVPYSQSLTAGGGSPPYSWVRVQGSLPNGLTLSYSGTISGTPTATGTSRFLVGVIDSAGGSTSGTINLTINPGAPVFVSGGGVTNAASFAVDANGNTLPVAPGSLVSIFGAYAGATPGAAAAAPYPFSLGGVSVTFNGFPAPLTLVVPGGQYPFINAQMPFEALSSDQGSASVDVVVTVKGTLSAPQPVSIVPAAPGIFTIPPTGQGNAVLVFIDPADRVAKIAAPVLASGSIGYPTAPVPRGQAAFFYATGLGALTPPVDDGSGGTDAPLVAHSATSQPIVTVGGSQARVDFAGQAPGYPGVNQINIVIPLGVTPGDGIPLQIHTADGSVYSNIGTISIR